MDRTRPGARSGEVASFDGTLLDTDLTLRVGHVIRLDVTQNDAPYPRLSNVPSSSHSTHRP